MNFAQENQITINKEEILIKNATIHNIKNLSLNIPLNKFVSIIGQSGSGKSSLIYGLFFKQYKLNKINNKINSKIYALKQKNYISKKFKKSTGEYNLEKFNEIKKKLNKDDILILDEPCAGLNKEDTLIYVNEIKKLIEKKISVIVVEHSKHLIKESEYIIEFGPEAGRNGGKVVFEGEIKSFKKTSSISSKFLFKKEKIKLKEKKTKNLIKINHINKNNLKKFNLEFPLYKLTCISGSIGSGKSTLLEYIYKSMFKGKDAWKIREDINYNEENIFGKQNIRRSYIISQNPISNNPNSLVATYINILDELKNIYLQLNKSKEYKLTKKDFNINKKFNINKINSKILEIKYHDLNFYQILNLTINEVYELFRENKIINRKLKFLKKLNLGYLVINQKSSTLSGGEAQRIKLCKILTKKLGDRCLYLLDTPSKGLHMNNIPLLLKTFQEIINKKNTIIVVENNFEIANNSNYLIKL